MELLNNKALEQATLSILRDSIMWDRVNQGMTAVINAFNPQQFEESLLADDYYLGYMN